MDDEQCFEFVEAVHSEDILWNITHKEFKDTNKKNKIWLAIGSMFNISGIEAYQKFRALREKYRREKQKEEFESRSGAAARKSGWSLMNNMRFLDDCYKRRRVCDSLLWKKKCSLQESSNRFSTGTVDNDLGDQILSVNTASTTSDTASTTSDTASTTSDSLNISGFEYSEYATSPVVQDTIQTEQPSSQDQYMAQVPSGFRQYESTMPSIRPVSIPLISPPAAMSPPLIRSPSPSCRPSIRPTCSRTTLSSSPVSTSSLEKTFATSTNNLIDAVRARSQPLPYENIVRFIQQALIDVGPEKAPQLEKELMEITFKYKYGN